MWIYEEERPYILVKHNEELWGVARKTLKMAEAFSQKVPNGTGEALVANAISTESSTRIQRHQEEKYLPGGWIVQKFGGTSVGKFARGIAEDIVR